MFFFSKPGKVLGFFVCGVAIGFWAGCDVLKAGPERPDIELIRGPGQLYLPTQYSVSSPVIVFLHGLNSRREHMAGPAERAVDLGFAALTVSAPIQTRIGYAWPQGAAVDATFGYLKKVIEQYSNIENLDFRRWYVAGFSQGGWYSVLLTANYPLTILGAMAMSPVVMTAQMPEFPSPKRPLYLFAGLQDQPAAIAAGFFKHLWKADNQPVEAVINPKISSV